MSRVALALDTSTPYLSAAIVREADGVVWTLASRLVGPPAIVSTLVPGVFDELLSEAALKLADVDVFVAGLGPGLFTGVRIAVGTMKALAYSRQRPVLGAGSLEAIALGMAHPSDLLCPVIDARKGEAYWSLHRMNGTELIEVEAPVASKPSVLFDRLMQTTGPVRLAGTGAALLSDLPKDRFTLLGSPLASGAAEIAKLALMRNPGATWDAAQCLALEPRYLRPPEAEVARKKREELTHTP